MVGGVAIAFAILVFSEITPKVVGAAHADRIAPLVSLRARADAAGCRTRSCGSSTCSCRACLRLLRLKPDDEVEARAVAGGTAHLVLEGQYFRGKHRAMLANLFDLEHRSASTT